MFYTIGEMAEKLGVAPSTLRYYDKEGLLPFVERSKGGIRMFQDGDYEFLKIIECLKKTGMQLKDIKEFIHLVALGNESIDERLVLFQKQRQQTLIKMESLKETLDTINFKCWYYETAKKLGATSMVDCLSGSELPEEMAKIRKKLKNS